MLCICPGSFNTFNRQLLFQTMIQSSDLTRRVCCFFHCNSHLAFQGAPADSIIVFQNFENVETFDFLNSSCRRSRDVTHRPWWYLASLEVSKHVLVDFSHTLVSWFLDVLYSHVSRFFILLIWNRNNVDQMGFWSADRRTPDFLKMLFYVDLDESASHHSIQKLNH